jgi:hypothetical protein
VRSGCIAWLISVIIFCGYTQALASVLSLRVQEGDCKPAAAAVQPVEEEGGKGKKGKKGKGSGGAAGMALGRGTSMLRSAIEARLCNGDVAEEMAALSLAEAVPTEKMPGWQQVGASAVTFSVHRLICCQLNKLICMDIKADLYS